MSTSNPAEMNPRSMETLRAIMKALRTPETGCPWDLEQNFETIAPYTIEEAYEVADAIARGDRGDLCQELGDLLFQVIYHAQLAEEEGAFGLDEIVEAINRKMLRRHPHVFGDEKARSAALAKDFWENAKAREREPAQSGTLDNVPVALPGLSRAVKLQAKAAKVGFDWPDVSLVYDKVEEELKELRSTSQEEREGEYGDLLFALANLGRHLKVDPEAALRRANEKFVRRFRFIEERLAAQGKSPLQSNLEEMDALWDEAKSGEA